MLLPQLPEPSSEPATGDAKQLATGGVMALQAATSPDLGLAMAPAIGNLAGEQRKGHSQAVYRPCDSGGQRGDACHAPAAAMSLVPPGITAPTQMNSPSIAFNAPQGNRNLMGDDICSFLAEGTRQRSSAEHDRTAGGLPSFGGMNMPAPGMTQPLAWNRGASQVTAL